MVEDEARTGSGFEFESLTIITPSASNDAQT